MVLEVKHTLLEAAAGALLENAAAGTLLEKTAAAEPILWVFLKIKGGLSLIKKIRAAILNGDRQQVIPDDRQVLADDRQMAPKN